MEFYTTAGALQATLNTTGLGVGVASPAFKLDIAGSIQTTADVRIKKTGSDTFASGPFVYLNSGDGSGNGSALQLNATNGLDIWNSTGGVWSRRLTVDSAGNCGIGVAPSAWGSMRAVQVLGASFVGDVTINRARVIANAFYTGSAYNYLQTNFAQMYVQNALDGTHSWHVAPSGTAGNAITFTQAMTLDASGNLNLGVTGRSEKLAVYGSAVTQALCLLSGNTAGDLGNSAFVVSKFDNNTTTSQVFVRFFVNALGAGSGQINANGASQAAFGSYSDSRLKENIVSLPSQLANILSLRPVEFDYKDGSGHQIGFVAQEIQQVYSDAVGENEGFLTVTGWSKTEARLVSAIKELAAKVKALEAKLA
jgi:hypothetical protein